MTDLISLVFGQQRWSVSCPTQNFKGFPLSQPNHAQPNIRKLELGRVENILNGGKTNNKRVFLTPIGLGFCLVVRYIPPRRVTMNKTEVSCFFYQVKNVRCAHAHQLVNQSKRPKRNSNYLLGMVWLRKSESLSFPSKWLHVSELERLLKMADAFQSHVFNSFLQLKCKEKYHVEKNDFPHKII